MSTSIGLVVSLVQAQHLNLKMLSTSPSAAHQTFATSGTATLVYNHTFGIDQYGKPTANFPIDGIVGGLGAFPWRDGLDHGGTMSSTMNPVGSVEAVEREIPFLYLYRREATDAGGHGKWRGGACLVAAVVGHRSPQHFISSGGLVQSVTMGMGALGGWPATGGTMWRAEDCAIREWFAAGRLPGTPDALREMAPEGGPAPSKKFDNRLFEHDVFEVLPNPGAGYGDPLERDPQMVAEDVRDTKLSVEDAASVNGVSLDEAGAVEEASTTARREDVRRQRLADARPPREARDGTMDEVRGRALATVLVGTTGDGRHVLGCAHCRQALAPAGGNYRLGTCELERPMTEMGTHFLDPMSQIGEDLVWRSYLCPACATALDGELCRPTDEPVWDVRLAVGEASVQAP